MTQLNEALLKKADAAHLVKLDKVRADTTVVPANVAYPTDSGLLAKGVAKLARTVWSLKQMGFAARTCFRDRTRLGPPSGALDRSMATPSQRRGEDRGARHHRRARRLGRGDHRRRARRRPQRQAIARSCRQAAPGKVVALVTEIEQTAKLLEQIVAQTRTRLVGEVPDGIENRIVSLHDQDARPIAKGTARKAGRVRFQGTDHRQLRRHRLRPGGVQRQPD